MAFGIKKAATPGFAPLRAALPTTVPPCVKSTLPVGGVGQPDTVTVMVGCCTDAAAGWAVVVVGAGSVMVLNNEKERLNFAVPPTMSVPMRSQSGSRLALRIQACRSGGPAGPGAESQRKCPLASATCGTKK